MLTRKMKDSGIEWIGEIPEDWDVSKIGSHYIERTDKVSDLEFEPLSVTKNGIVPQLESAAKSSNHNNRKLVLKNDFVINSRSDRKMSAGISSMDGSVSVINTVLYSKTIDRNYTKYLLKNYSFAEEFYRWGTGIVDDLWSTKWLKMKNISIPVPPNDKQKQIGQTLDRLTQNTNNIITETQQSIEELKKYKQSLITEAVTKGLDPNVEMKDSGIEWIGKLPIHWTVSKVKQFYEVVSGGTPKSNNTSYWDGDIVWITPADYQEDDVYVAKSNRTISMEGVQNSSAEIVPRNSIIVSNRAPIGKIALTDIELSTNQGCKAMVKKKNINNKFIYYFMYIMQEVLEEFGHGTTFRELSTEALKNFKFPVPCIEEQQQIVSYLDEQTSRIDKLIEDKTKVIEELEDYKKSLIYEYVTGKKEV